MKTDDLINLLATEAGAVEPHAAERRFAKAIGCGVVGALILMLSILRIRSDLADAVLQPIFWLKIGFVASLMAASLFGALRLSRPGARLNWVPGAIGTPMLFMWTIAVLVLIQADPGQRLPLFLGSTWSVCPFLIALISLPVFVAVMWAMKGLAPTRTRLAGFVAGLLAGATAALVYCLHCPEVEAPFIGFWYVMGMMIPAAFGTLLADRLLRW